MDTQQIEATAIIQADGQFIVQTYKRPPFVLTHGKGAILYDTEGNAYTDWVAGIAVNALGYGDEGLAQAIQAQISTGILHTSNLYHTAPQSTLAQKLVESAFADRVFFCNSGTEANEGAIKFARKVAYSKGLTDKTEIITFSGAFHGRTMGSLSLTPKEKYQAPFKPLLPGVHVATFNDLDSVKAVISEQTAAVIVEPIQGEGGINLATTEFLQGLRALCDEFGAALIFDEVQCGVGRTGKLWAHEWSGVTPDILTAAKPLAGGLPIGAILCTAEVADCLHPGDHGSTFAGGPVVMRAALEVVERVDTPEFLAQVQDVGDYLLESLNELDNPHVVALRGRGLMVAMELDVDVAPLIQQGYEHGLLLVNAGQNVLRFVPPLIVGKPHVDELVGKLKTMLEKLG